MGQRSTDAMGWRTCSKGRANLAQALASVGFSSDKPFIGRGKNTRLRPNIAQFGIYLAAQFQVRGANSFFIRNLTRFD
jgi:hypothetical protein